MKKIFLILLIVFSFNSVKAQRYSTDFVVNTVSETFTRPLPIYSTVLITDSAKVYMLTASQAAGSTMSAVITAGQYEVIGAGTEAFASALTIKTLKQSVTNGTKTGNITHDVVDHGNSGAYQVNNAGALTVNIHDLESGIGGAVYLNIVTANPSSITVNFYSDNGVTSISKREFGTISSTLGKTTVINFDCVSDGTNIYVITTYGESN